MLEVKKVNKEYKLGISVLKDVSFKLGDKGLVSILGKSGSGKSTLLNLIGLVDKVSSGSIIVDGKNITKFNYQEKIDYHFNHIGFIFQQYNLFNNMSVIDNINLIMDYDNADNVLKKLDIYDLKDKLVSELSGGQKQRVAIARALVKNPKILLCDEPTGALDSINSKIVMDLLKEISKSILVIVVTHNREDACKYSNQILEIKDGKIITLKKDYKVNNKYEINNTKIKLKKIINIVKINLKNKRKRNILTILAFCIGLISLSLVLGIKNGFNKSLDIEEKNTLSKYPIYISEASTNLDNDIEDVFKIEDNDNNKVYASNNNHKNIITKDYINTINSLKTDNKLLTYNIDNNYIITVDNFDFINKKNILYGTKNITSNESLLVIDSNNNIDKYLLKSIGLNNNEYDYKDIIGYKYSIDNKNYIIRGIIKLDNDFYSPGIYYLRDNFKDNNIYEIYLYSKDYKNKKDILNKLDKYKDIYYTDYASTFKNLSKSIFNGLSIILLCFSFISLIVSSIMISILSYIRVVERIRDIGIYKSMGLSNGYIKLIFYLENLYICFISAFISVNLVDLVSVILNHFIELSTGLIDVINLGIKNELFVLLLSVIISLISSRTPLKEIKKYDIVNIINKE